ncbi:hypothetical protein TVAGG3_0295930 [Trichomonas vaginalis G3]|uniref:hypothetical protein n=1 Tax=Trichomonas vaginalis (strain ATCC PRA-98 / G3) TaxID=412133 RepID=UPI0021E5DF7D|nr:hypothetical protein TVAGG3_0295930 [Trichomonas vaginalis G3]KAI5527606.1 hypothetical protein TVAGG3_0295930 [Trichomonas vaginalis G3]
MWIEFLLLTLSKDPKRKELIYKKKNILTEPKVIPKQVIKSVQYNDGKEVTSGNPYTAKIILETGLNITKTYYLFATESEASNASATSVAISQNAINATAVASTNKTEWTFKVNATKDHNKTKLLVVVETDADHKSNLGTGNVTYSPTVSTPVIESVQYNDGKEVTSGNPYTAKIILETGLNITKTYYLFATESEASNASATSVAISQNAINATAVASTNKTEWTFKVNATKDHNKTKLLVVVETDADHKSNLGTGNVTYSPTVSTPVIESVQYNDGKEVTSGNPYTAKIILETGLNITKTYYLFATESEASNASATSVAISQNAINATAVASTNKTEWTFKVNATKDHNKTKLLVVVETDADHKSNLGTGNVTYSPQSHTSYRECSIQRWQEVISGNPYTAKIILETGLNITKTYYLFATESEASNASA